VAGGADAAERADRRCGRRPGARAMQAMLAMKKIDIAALERAADAR
jgi:predicted 3-demethylubiquinone-9 3-methyltransferase (glyoxalase superfamily)